MSTRAAAPEHDIHTTSTEFTADWLATDVGRQVRFAGDRSHPSRSDR
jgi:hypothetical protein